MVQDSAPHGGQLGGVVQEDDLLDLRVTVLKGFEYPVQALAGALQLGTGEALHVRHVEQAGRGVRGERAVPAVLVPGIAPAEQGLRHAYRIDAEGFGVEALLR